MWIILFLLFIESVISLFLKGFLNNYQGENLILIYIIINLIVIIYTLYLKIDNKKIFMILICGFLIRIIMLIYDNYVVQLPFNNVDANTFHHYAVITSENLPDKMLEFYNGKYTQFLGIVYYIFGPYRIWGHFLNIIFSVLASLKLVEIFEMLKIQDRNKILGVGLFTFMPIPILIGYALLRESTIYYCLVVSLYYFIKFITENKKINLIFASVFIYIAGIYHSGLLITIVIYLYYLVFYDTHEKKIKKSIIHNIVVLIAIILAINYITINSEKIFETANMKTGGGSAYLTELNIENPIEFILYTPIKAVYLVFSPMPWLIRGGLDGITFLFDALIYFRIFLEVIKNRKYIDSKIKGVILIFVVNVLVYGMGTLNTGTAIRHRNKFLVFAIVIYIYFLERKHEENLNRSI